MKIVKVEWEDAVAVTDETIPINEINGLELTVVVERLVKETENAVVLSTTVGEGCCKDLYTIPKKLIKRIVEFELNPKQPSKNHPLSKNHPHFI